MHIAARYPFAYKAAAISTSAGVLLDRVLVDTIDVDVPVLSSAKFPVAVSWKTDFNYRTPSASFDEGRGKPMYIRHHNGRFYRPLGLTEASPGLAAESLPGRGKADFGTDLDGQLAFLSDRRQPSGEDRFKSVRGWLAGKYKRQPKEEDVIWRTDSDYLIRKAEAEVIASRLAVIDGIVHAEVYEPKLAVGTCYFHRRDDMPEGVSNCPLIAIFFGESRFGAQLPHFNSRPLDAKTESLVVSITELAGLLSRFEGQGVPVLLDFDDLAISEDVDFGFDGKINRRWRVVGEAVSRFANQVLTMPTDWFQAWARLRDVSMLSESDVSSDVLDGVYDDYVRLCSTIDAKDRDRARLLEAAEWWNEAEISFGASIPMSPRTAFR